MIRNTLTTLKLVFLFGSAGGLAIAACSSNDATDKYPSADSFCDAKATEECNAAAAVCSATVDFCKTTRVGICKSFADSATSQGRTYRAQQAEKCVDATKTLYATKVVDLDKEKDVDDTCEHVFTGSKKKNDPCTQPYECEGTLKCDKGACADAVQKQLNEPCNNPGDTCVKGTYCGPRGGSNFCIARNNVGDICNNETPCLETLRCVNNCQAKLDSGQPCDTNDDCTSGFCGNDKKCAAKLVPGTGKCSDFGGS